MAVTSQASASVEALERVLTYLVTERRRLRFHGASRSEVEANRRAILAMQNQLGRVAAGRYRRSTST
jgi:coenzyme F420-reducing hydrogenase delta subunit